ncbi:MAG: hypothetical protein LBB45_08355 [Methanobrevibacter sp.]|jgi:hypothetical protein|nr:hypothetical protein [Candidatus Methanovirga basalitermitum]
MSKIKISKNSSSNKPELVDIYNQRVLNRNIAKALMVSLCCCSCCCTID